MGLDYEGYEVWVGEWRQLGSVNPLIRLASIPTHPPQQRKGGYVCL